MDRCRGEVVPHEEVAQHVRHALRLDEHERQAEILLVLRREDVEQHAALVVVLYVLDLLGDVLRRAAHAPDAQEHVVLEEVLREHLDVPWEGGAKHECLPLGHTGHVLAPGQCDGSGVRNPCPACGRLHQARGT